MSAYKSNKEVSVDDSMVKYKERLFFKHYLPSKRSGKWGIKVWSFCDASTTFHTRFQVYIGRETASPEQDLGHSVVTELVHGLDKGHIVCMGNFYSNLLLYDELRFSQLGACDTVRGNRERLPTEMNIAKLKRGDLPADWKNAVLGKIQAR